VALQIACSNVELKSQTHKVDHNNNSINHEYREGDLVLLRIFNLRNKNRKLAKRWDSQYKIVKIMG
jgi:hypothetical protein